MGFPYSGGWAEQPKRVVDVIELLESCFNEEQAEKQKRDNKSPKGPKQSSGKLGLSDFGKSTL